MTDPALLLYGATGYTGALLAEAAAAARIPVRLAGRSETSLRPLAERLGLPFAVAPLEDRAAVDRAFEGVRCVLHCAGPFSSTSAPIVDACFRHRVHYLDITGEIPVFEALAARDAEAKAAGIMVLPGVGFDVVPSDCLAAHVKRRLPSATRLRLCIRVVGALSHGTAKTMVEHLDTGGAVRKGGRIVSEPAGKRRHRFDVGGKHDVLASSMPWGDVATAFHSTQIPDVEVYFALTRGTRLAMKIMPVLAPLLRQPAVKRFVQSSIPPGGPSADARARGKSVVVAEAEDDAGARVVSRFTGPEGYSLTVDAALRSAQHVLAGRATPGFRTASLAFGPDFALELSGTARVDVI